MSYDVKAIREAVASKLQPLVDDGTLVAAHSKAKSSPTLPCAMVTVGKNAFDESMAGGDCLKLNVLVVYSMSNEDAAQDALDELIGRGTNSIKSLLEADPRLGSLVEDLRVTSADGYRPYELANGPALGALWSIDLLVQG